MSCAGEVGGREDLCASRRNSLLFEDEGQVEEEAYEASEEEAQEDKVEIEKKEKRKGVMHIPSYIYIYHDLCSNILIGFCVLNYPLILLHIQK